MAFQTAKGILGKKEALRQDKRSLMSPVQQ